MALAVAPVGIVLACLAVLVLLVLADMLGKLSAQGRGLPVIGPGFANIVDGIIGGILSAAHWVSDRLVGIVVWSVNATHVLITQLASAVVGGVAATTAAIGGDVAWLIQQVHGVEDAFNTLNAFVYNTVFAQVHDVQGAFNTLNAFVYNTVFAQLHDVQGLFNGINDQLNHPSQGIAPRVTALQGTVAAQQARIDAQARTIGDQAIQVRALQQALQQAQGAIQAVQAQARAWAPTIAGVAPLAGVVAISADAVTNLGRVARDPCYCLNSGDGAGLVELVEEIALQVA